MAQALRLGILDEPETALPIIVDLKNVERVPERLVLAAELASASRPRSKR